MLTSKRSPFLLNNLLFRCCVISTLATTTVLMGRVPTFSHASLSLSWQNAAYAQNINAQELLNFAKVLLAIEPLRQSIYNDIQRILGSKPVPNIVCSQPSSFSNLPSNARQIAINYCNSSREIVRSNGFTIDRFNQMTAMVQSDADLKRRVQNAMIQLQR